MLTPVKKTTYNILGFISLVLAFIGLLLPIMPTTPFCLLATFFFNKSSPRFHAWVMSLPYFGDAVRDWDENRTISRKSKLMATLTLVGAIGIAVFKTGIPTWVRIVAVLIQVGIIIFINTRKSGN